jgi:hypothetical protein
MFRIDDESTIHITRGDVGVIEVDVLDDNGEQHIFKPGDIVRLQVYVRKQHANVVLAKEVRVLEETPTVDINLESADTKLGDIINKPVDYWYEIEINPDTVPQTIIGYDEDGPRSSDSIPKEATSKYDSS